MKLVSITKATDGKHKYTAIFDVDGKSKTVHFGAKNYNDFTIYSKQDKQLAEIKKKAYLARHEKRETWSDPTSPGSLSRHLLWGDSSSLKQNIIEFKKKFNL
jgi:RNA recognition motif-containing protein